MVSISFDHSSRSGPISEARTPGSKTLTQSQSRPARKRSLAAKVHLPWPAEDSECGLSLAISMGASLSHSPVAKLLLDPSEQREAEEHAGKIRQPVLELAFAIDDRQVLHRLGDRSQPRARQH